MVVLLILAILLAIAIPTFLSATGGANDEAAQSNLNTGLTTPRRPDPESTDVRRPYRRDVAQQGTEHHV